MAFSLLVPSRVAREEKELARAQGLYWETVPSSIPSCAAACTTAWYSAGEMWLARLSPAG